MAKVRQRKSWTHDKFIDDFGNTYWVHKRVVCTGTHCAIHNPSDHHMKTWPMLVRASTLIERMCGHRCGHPDPDSVAFFESVGKGHLSSHGCDLCCWSPRDILQDAYIALEEAEIVEGEE